MKEIGIAIQGAILLGCLFALVAIVVGCIFAETFKGWKVWRRKRHMAAVSVLACVAVYVGGTKPPRINIVWDDGLHDNGSAIDTNDLRQITIRWTYEAWIPPQSMFTLSAIPIDSLGQDSSTCIVTVASVPITDLALNVLMERDATNYFFFAEQSYIPDAPVVTNGVYHLRCVGGNNVWMPIGADFIISEMPKTAKSYIQSGLVAMWDSIENAGYGVHANSSTWKDLVGSCDGTASNLTWGDDFAYFNGSNTIVELASRDPFESDYLQVEFVVTLPSNILTHTLFNAGGTLGRHMVFQTQYGAKALRASFVVWSLKRGGHCYSVSHSPRSSVSAYEDGVLLVGSDGGSFADYGSTAHFGATRKNGYWNFFFRGKIHSIRLYSRELTDEERAFNLAIDRKRFNTD